MSKPKHKEDEFQSFLGTARRAPRAGAYEHLLSQFLASAVVVTDPLKRVKIVTEAALMIPESQRTLAIDYEKVKVLNLVANALLNRSIHKLEKQFEVVSVPWGFPQIEKNFTVFIDPWFDCNLLYWPTLIVKHVEKWQFWECRECNHVLAKRKLPCNNWPAIPSKCSKCGHSVEYSYNRNEYTREKIVKNPYWSFFFEITARALAPRGYDLLRNNFSAWSIPIVQQYLAELTRVVSPGLYGQILGLYTRRGKRSYAEKVKEASEVQKRDESGLEPEL